MRAMPLQRLLSGGMDLPDALALHEDAAHGVPWETAAERLGDAAADRAEAARAYGHPASARSWALYASAAYRFGQNPLADEDPVKRRLYDRLLHWFGDAAALTPTPIERVEIPYQGGSLCGWLLLPAGGGRVPVVIQMGGFDGWREEYHLNAIALLERGVGSLLVDGPGQGETRLYHNLYLHEDVDAAFSAIVDHLLSDERCDGQVAIWGNSLGGFIAALVCCRDDRLAACVVNGGTIRPSELPERHPRFMAKVQALFGEPDPERAAQRLGCLGLAEELQHLRCPLHVVHGTPDRVFLIANARALHDRAASQDRTFSEFPDGDHCIYNRAHERNCLIGDWLVERIGSTTGGEIAC
jgi:alpha-beta hydrolase superfamily lysophospholipase